MRRRIVCATAVLLALGLAFGAATAGVAAQESDSSNVTIEAEFEDSEIDVGETTRLNLTLEEVPDGGTYGATVEFNLDGDVVLPTGTYNNTADWTFSELDLEDSDDVSAGVVTMTDATNGINESATTVDLGSVEVVGVGNGSIDGNVSVQSLQNRDEEEVNRSVDPASLSVDAPQVDATFANESVLVGGTTDLTLTLDEVPTSGAHGATIEVALDGSAVELTGADAAEGDWTVDVDAGDDNTTAVVDVTADGNGAAAGATDVELATLAVEAVAEGSTTADVSVESLQIGDSLDVRPTAGADTVEAGCYVGNASEVAPVTASLDAESVEPGATTDVDVRLESVSRRCYEDASFEVSVDNETATFTGGAEALANGTNLSVNRSDANATATVDANLSASSGATPAAPLTLGSLELDAVAEGTTNVTVSNVSVGSGNDSVAFGSRSSVELTVEQSTDEEDSSGGGGGFFAPSGGSDEASDDADEDADDADEAPPEFDLSLESSAGPMVVFSAEHARAEETATADVGTSLGGLELTNVEATAGSESEAFQLTVAAGDRSGPDVEGDVVQTLTVDGDGVLDSAELTFSVEESAVDDDADAGDLTVYRYSDGEWSATSEGAAGESFSAEVDSAGALAVVAAPDETTEDTGSDDSLGILGLDVVLALLALSTVFAIRLRATE